MEVARRAYSDVGYNNEHFLHVLGDLNTNFEAIMIVRSLLIDAFWQEWSDDMSPTSFPGESQLRLLTNEMDRPIIDTYPPPASIIELSDSESDSGKEWKLEDNIPLSSIRTRLLMNKTTPCSVILIGHVGEATFNWTPEDFIPLSRLKTQLMVSRMTPCFVFLRRHD